MHYFSRSLPICAVATLLWITAACSPLVNRPGAPVSEPRIEAGHFITADGASLPLRHWLPPQNPPRATIIALHGFNDYSAFFDSSGRFLAQRGIASYAYDQRGFGAAPGRGLWWGSEAYCNDLSSFSREIRRRHPGVPLYILGESMGGAVTIAAMTGNNKPDVDGVILSAPAVWGRETMPWYQRWLLAITAHTLPWLELTGKGLHVQPSDNTEMLRGLGRDPLVIKATRVETIHGLVDLMDSALARSPTLSGPALILYGKHDQVIPKEPTLQMLEMMPRSVRTVFFDNGYHMLLRDLEAEKPLSDIATWIADHNKPLPYGTDRW